MTNVIERDIVNELENCVNSLELLAKIAASMQYSITRELEDLRMLPAWEHLEGIYHMSFAQGDYLKTALDKIKAAQDGIDAYYDGQNKASFQD